MYTINVLRRSQYFRRDGRRVRYVCVWGGHQHSGNDIISRRTEVILSPVHGGVLHHVQVLSGLISAKFKYPSTFTKSLSNAGRCVKI